MITIKKLQIQLLQNFWDKKISQEFEGLSQKKKKDLDYVKKLLMIDKNLIRLMLINYMNKLRNEFKNNFLNWYRNLLKIPHNNKRELKNPTTRLFSNDFKSNSKLKSIKLKKQGPIMIKTNFEKRLKRPSILVQKRPVFIFLPNHQTFQELLKKVIKGDIDFVD